MRRKEKKQRRSRGVELLFIPPPPSPSPPQTEMWSNVRQLTVAMVKINYREGDISINTYAIYRFIDILSRSH